jgi:hypothetical protein
MQANTALVVRKLLAEWQEQDGVDPKKSGLQDPPLLALEVEAASAELALLRESFAESGDVDEDIAKQRISILLEACVRNLARFESSAVGSSSEGGAEKKVCKYRSNPAGLTMQWPRS